MEWKVARVITHKIYLKIQSKDYLLSIKSITIVMYSLGKQLDNYETRVVIGRYP